MERKKKVELQAFFFEELMNTLAGVLTGRICLLDWLLRGCELGFSDDEANDSKYQTLY